MKTFSFYNLTVLDNDDVAIMDLVARQEGDLGRPRPLTGSAAKEPAMEEYSLESGSQPHSLLFLFSSSSSHISVCLSFLFPRLGLDHLKVNVWNFETVEFVPFLVRRE